VNDVATKSPKAPRARLRTRVTWFFFFAALPAALVSGVAEVVLDRLIREEVVARADDVASSVMSSLRSETARVRIEVAKIADSDDFKRQVLEPLEHPGDVEDEEARIDQRNQMLAEAAQRSSLDILALVGPDERGHRSILASAHLRTAVGDDAPRFAALEKAPTSTVAFAHELVAGNPPAWAPAIIAVEAIGDKTHLVLYGGSRLDTHRLEDIATNGRALLVLDSPRLRRLTFPSGVGVDGTLPPDRPQGRTIVLPSLLHGRDPTPAASAFIDPHDSADLDRPTRLFAFADTARLERARSFLLSASIALVALAMLLALIAAASLSRSITTPIVELSRAAQAIGGGNLDVRIDARSNDEVGALVDVFNDMTAELAESRVRLQRAERIAAWREIARRVAHEIKNPLFPIQMSIETLRKGFKNKHPKLDEIVDESTRTVLEEVRALNRIVTEFSDFARLPAPKLETVEVLELFEHVASLYGANATNNPSRAPSGAPPQPPARVLFDRVKIAAHGTLVIAADREQIARALINLVKNAIEAMPATGGTVTLDAVPEIRAEARGVAIAIADTGSGIPEDVLQKIFTPYFTTKAQGTGLGLAIVERVVQEHRGSIDVESAVGKGTTFHIWLPS
jgi:nitrogen fixation/metabolism regulation signal transduction histidine kinase